MTMIEKYRDRLESLELERLKVVRDRQTYRFLSVLLAALGACSLIASVIGESFLVGCLALFLIVSAGGIWRYRKTLAEAYQIKFRENVTREWFSDRFRSAYLAPPPSELSEELMIAVREAAVRATNQSPKTTVIEERILFDRDTHTSQLFVLREGSALKPKSRSLVWCKLRSGDDGLVAFVWPPALKTQKNLDVRFFKDGKSTSVIEPLASRLEHLYELASRLTRHSSVRVGYSPRGVFLGCRLKTRLFEAPVEQSVFEPTAYSTWEVDAALPLSQELRNQIGSLI